MKEVVNLSPWTEEPTAAFKRAIAVAGTGLASTDATVRILVNGTDVTNTLPAPEVSTDNDPNTADLDKAWTYRATTFAANGVQTVVAQVTDGSGTGTKTQRIGVQPFAFTDARGTNIAKKNIVLFIGDAMGTAYRDSGRLVAKSTGNRFREGFFDQLQSMDTMPASGMVMTYALDRVVPDSANTASAWCTGNKALDGSMGVFPDNNDFKVNTGAATLQSTKQFALDNPRVETLWEYLKRLYGYKTGVVSTADITDATPAGEGSHTLLRALTFDIARQFVDGTFTAPNPTFDVILGGGREHFDLRNATNSGDTRNFINELQSKGYAYVTDRPSLNALADGAGAPDRLLGLFYSSAGVNNTIAPANTGANGNMNVTYDKLGLARPRDESGSNSANNTPNFNGFTNQPYLDEMTAKAIGAGGTGASVGATTLAPGNGGGNAGEVTGFTNYADQTFPNGMTYPDNANRFKLAVGFRTGNHAGSSVPITADGPGSLLFTGYFDQTDVFFKMAKTLSSDTTPLDEFRKIQSRLGTISPNY